MSSRKFGFVCTVALLTATVLAFPASADDVWPPDWRGQPFSTLQIWEFSQPGAPWPPDVVINPCGPVAPFFPVSGDYTWYPFLHGRLGVVSMPSTNALQVEFIGNCDRPDWAKEIWIQTTMYGFLGPMHFEVIIGGQYFRFDNPPLIGQIDHPDGWITAVHLLELPFCPDGEWMEIWFDSPIGEDVDQVVIDTRCIEDGGGNPADLNGDGVVNLLDLAIFAQIYFSGVYDPAADLNGDGVIDLADVVLFAEAYLNQ